MFESYIRELEDEHDDKNRLKGKLERRLGRKTRENFEKLLNEVEEEGGILPFMKWKEFVEVWKDHELFKNGLVPADEGSDGLHLFWDRVDKIEQLASKQQQQQMTNISNNKRGGSVESSSRDDYSSRRHGSSGWNGSRGSSRDRDRDRERDRE